MAQGILIGSETIKKQKSWAAGTKGNYVTSLSSIIDFGTFKNVTSICAYATSEDQNSVVIKIEYYNGSGWIEIANGNVYGSFAWNDLEFTASQLRITYTASAKINNSCFLSCTTEE